MPHHDDRAHTHTLAPQSTKQTRKLDKRIVELENSRKAMTNLLEDLEEERRELAEAKAKDDAMLASIGDGVIIVDTGGNITFINQSGQRLLGWKSKEIVGKLLFDIVQIEDKKGMLVPQDMRPITMALGSVLPDKTTPEVYYYVRKDKTKFPVAVTVAPVLLEKKIIGAIEVFRDISKERAIEQAKSEFLSLASHQLRTPLIGIEWTLELLSKKETLTPKGQEYLGDIRSSAHRLNALVTLLLSTSRIESGTVNVSVEPLELVGIIQAHIRECQPICEKKKISLRFAVHPKQLVAVTDKNLFAYILRNLVGNAIDYTPSGGNIEILLSKKNGLALLEVRDTGIGIPQKDQKHIFEKFIRGSNALTMKTDGTGLGLYIVERTTKLLGGNIRFESTEGKGSAFFVEIPLVTPSNGGGKGLVSLS